MLRNKGIRVEVLLEICDECTYDPSSSCRVSTGGNIIPKIPIIKLIVNTDNLKLYL